jgi:hypothetical protein
MTDRPDRFEVQRFVAEGNRAGQWNTMTDSLPHEEAIIQGEAFRQHNKGERYRVVPFGTGPTQAEPADGAPPAQFAAWTIICRRVDAEGGNRADIVLHGDSYRWYSPPDHPDHPSNTAAIGWERDTEREIEG